MAKRAQRGELWLARLDEKRPVVILSAETTGEVRAMIVVAPGNADVQGIAIELKVGIDEGLSEEGVLRVALPRSDRILCNWLVTLGEGDLVERVGVLSPAKLGQLEEALRLGELE
jgi:mRNA interferase MazF